MEASEFVIASLPKEKLVKKPKGRRLPHISPVFLLAVFLPTVLATIYYGLIASDVYISESRFVIRSPQRQTSTNGLGTLLQGVGFSRAQDDTYPVHDFMLSRDALKRLDEQLAFAQVYSSTGLDRFSRFGGLEWWDKSFEALHRYYQKHVTIELDTASSISTLIVKAFDADTADRINTLLLEMGERLVNQLNERASQDMIRFASSEVAVAEAKAKSAALALSTYRNEKGIFDPNKQSGLQLEGVLRLQGELIAAKTQLAQLRSMSQDNPQIPVLQKRVDTLDAAIRAENAKVAGTDHSFSIRAAEYERLSLDQAFADKQLTIALASLEQARNEAIRQQLYLERIVQPNKPDYAVEPRRFRAVVATFALGMIAWGVLSMLIAGVREHRD
jgi:capsular polysaccharide transport system permease protein